MFCLTQHQNGVIRMICLNPECQQFPTACEVCSIEHEGHNTISTNKFMYSLAKYVDSKPPPPSLEQQQKNNYEIQPNKCRMQGDLECAAQGIYRMKYRLQRMSQFMNFMFQTMTSVEDTGEEQDLVTNLLLQLESQTDLVKLNRQFSSMFLLLQAVRQHDSDSGTIELQFAPTQISQIRTQSVLDGMLDFSKELKTNIGGQETIISEIFEQLEQLIKENNHIINLDSVTKKTQNHEQEVKSEERENQKCKTAYKEVCMVRELIGIDKCDKPQPYLGSIKIMMKLGNYWVFYHNIVCYGTLLEPNQNEIPLKKGKKVFPPIRCAFCRFITSKEFKNGYSRYDPIKKFGELCLFQDSQVREICVHEMCIFWSNRVSINLDTFIVDLNTIVMAVQYAKNQLCRYCGCIGASLKCNRPECQVHFHFSCIRQGRLMGMQLDFEAKYRFFCEDHVVRHNLYEPDWFLTRFRLMKIIYREHKRSQLKEQSNLPFEDLSNESDRDDNAYSSNEEENTQKKQKKQNKKTKTKSKKL